MDAHTRTGFSKECYNRLLIWQSALQQARRYLKVSQYLWENLRENQWLWDTYCAYEQDSQPVQVHVGLTSSSALVESAVILVRQIFSTGSKGPGFADNKKHPDINTIRNEMETYVQIHLGWSADEYEQFSKFIRRNCDKFLAHYDGSAAEYEEHPSGVTSMKMIGANLNCEQRDQLEQVVSTMITFLHSKIR